MGASLRVDDQIRGFEVAVDDTLRVCVRERFGHVANHLAAAPHVAPRHDQAERIVRSRTLAGFLGTSLRLAIRVITRPVERNAAAAPSSIGTC